MKSTIYTYVYRTDESLKKYRFLIGLGLSKIVYSFADSLSMEDDISKYHKEEFFDKFFNGNSVRIGFHYTVSKVFLRLQSIVRDAIKVFSNKEYFDKVSLLRFIPHGKGISDMDLSKEDLIAIKEYYLNYYNKEKIILGSPWNILGIENNLCIIAVEIMIIRFDGIAYPCDSIKCFT